MPQTAVKSGGKASDRIFTALLYALMTTVGVVTLYPFINILAISLNDSADTVRGGIYLWPRSFTLDNYRTIFQYSNLLTAFGNSVLRTVLGTFAGLFSASLIAYSLSRKDFVARRFVSLALAFTLYFSGGLVPVYMLIRDLHLLNSFWVYILPGLVSAWNVFILRSYIDGLPFVLQESAKLDGANDLQIFAKVILPLCKPVLATIALFLAVGQWNAWFDTFLYNGGRTSLTTLQYELMKILQNTSASGGNAAAVHGGQELANRVSPESIRMSITIVATVPILVVYPFLQNYFVKGLTLGAVKS
ncbi:carbohydrate ABC transporter permease [Cohnella sp. JJ-181]|uniref:carbohydrate ABC transporter permease n=1 Tax=Cohnella rhizoplanae TaxID=2974897 RepID=UPI0022FF8647|nr:carbohydrate ABC transporter permease [Cohnella sp. JJ-181]CAI6086980.1 L-arabinose transport system permease protein AraQ [Cohnella sp. JJ-181]